MTFNFDTAISQIQRDNFEPTFLYIKECNNLLYFGKTIKKDPTKYLGSGKHWTRHYKKYGRKSVNTVWYCLFYDIDDINKFALMFSRNENIVDSDNWANLIPETGLTGGSGAKSEITKMKIAESKKNLSPTARQNLSKINKGRKHTEESIKNMSLGQQNRSAETRKNMSESLKGKVTSAETKYKQSIAQKDIPRTEEVKHKISIAQKGIPRTHKTTKGYKHSDTTKNNMSVSRRKKWILTDEDGIEHNVDNLKEFCILHNINYSLMIKVAAGKSNLHNNWKCRHDII